MLKRVYISLSYGLEIENIQVQFGTADTIWYLLGGYHSQAQPLSVIDFDKINVFVGIYGPNYGPVPEGDTASITEQEYTLASQSYIPMLIFAQQEARETDDERQYAFLQYVARHNVINQFTSAEDLSAKLALAIKQLFSQQGTVARAQVAPPEPPIITPEPKFGSRTRSAVPPPTPAPAAPAPSRSAEFDESDEMAALEEQGVLLGGELATPDDPFEATIDRALALASDDLETIVRRALELHDAQRLVHEENLPDGWLKVDPLFGQPSMRSQFQMDIFMVMPFEEPYNSIYHDLIVPIANELNLVIKRGDEFASQRGIIISEVWAAMNGCRMVIADASLPNPNVYYELGIAHTLGKPTILLTDTQDFDTVPFDIQHLRFVGYENSIEGGNKLREDLRKNILWLLNDLQEADDTDGNADQT